MPRQTKKSSLLSKLGDKGRRAHEAHRSDGPSYSDAAELPAGIEGGIAQLVDCKFGTYQSGPNEGQPFFRAAGIVKVPQELGEIHVEGLRTKIGPEPLCETPNFGGRRKTFDAHYGWVLNQMRILGVETEETTFDDIEDLAATLEEEQPHFRFRTWIGKKQTSGPYKDREPRPQEEWLGHCDYVEDGEDGVVDETEEETRSASPEEKEDEALNDLAIAADDGDADAAEKLSDAAKEVGIDADDIDTWAEVVDAIRGADDPDTDEGVNAPEEGEVVFFKPPRARKKVECTVVAVFAGRETCTLKSLDDGKTFKAVPWNKLEE